MPDAGRPTTGLRTFVWIVTTCVAAGAVYGLILSGSPFRERMRRLDTARVQDLDSIADSCDQFWSREKRLPHDLEELRRSRHVILRRIEDPETRTPYEYRAVDEDSYELCAVFAARSEPDDRPAYSSGRRIGNFWEHASGRVCYTLTLDAAERD
jgi:hypothetical protein